MVSLLSEISWSLDNYYNSVLLFIIIIIII